MTTDYDDYDDECTAETIEGYSDPVTCRGCTMCREAIDEAGDDE